MAKMRMGKFPKIIRPEIEMEYSNLSEIFHILAAILHVGIRRVKCDVTLGSTTIDTLRYWVIPRYIIREATREDNQ